MIPLKRVFQIVGILLVCVVVVLWGRVLTSDRRDYLEVPPSGNHRDYIEGRRHTCVHFLLMSDRRGIVFDVFIRQLPPEKAPGPPWSQETQLWLKARAERSAAAYARLFGFKKGIEHRHGQYLNDPLYFYGVDHYIAVPHLFLIFLFALPAMWPLRHHFIHCCRKRSCPNVTHANDLSLNPANPAGG